jgi:hypothetical protein
MKFLRNYLVQIQPPDDAVLEITKPISAHIEVSRDVLASTNNASLTFYNLSPTNRHKLYKDQYDVTHYWKVRVYGAYESNVLTEIFRGNLSIGKSRKEGTDWITELEAYDAQYAINNSYVNTSIASGATQLDLVNTASAPLISNGITKGVLGSPATSGDATVRGTVLMGPSADLLNYLTGGNYYFDNETLNALSYDEAIALKVFELDHDIIYTTPTRSDAIIELDTLFSPELKVGYLCKVKSLAPEMCGQFKIQGIKHTLDVLSNQCGDASSHVSLYYGAGSLTQVG